MKKILLPSLMAAVFMSGCASTAAINMKNSAEAGKEAISYVAQKKRAVKAGLFNDPLLGVVTHYTDKSIAGSAKNLPNVNN